MAQHIQSFTAGAPLLSEPVPILHREEAGRSLEGGDAVYTARVILGLDPANLNLDYAKGPQSQTFSKDEIENIRLFPNPASDIINLIFNSVTEQNTVFELYDISSRKLLTQNIPPNTLEYTINLINIKSGIYYCRISNNNNNALLKSKLIITNK